MTTELPTTDQPANASEEEIQEPPPKNVSTGDKKGPVEIKRVQNSKFKKSNLNAETAQLRGKPARNDKSSGYRRKQP